MSTPVPTAGRDAMLVEYEAAQNSAQFNDQLVWTSTGITWGLSMLLFGFALNNSEKIVPVAMASVLGLLLIMFQWQVQRVQRSVKNQKYARCKELELALEMSQHSSLVYEQGSQTLTYRLVAAAMILAWIAVLYTSIRLTYLGAG